MIKIRIKPKTKINFSHDVFIGENIIKELPKFLKEKNLGNKYAIIADNKVAKIFGEDLLKLFKKEKIHCELFTFTAGEKSKSLGTIEKLAEKMLAAGIDRRDAILALGGGVTGDLAGFLASIYMRGIPYVHLPTSLLAMVDSSVGGKTGVDLKAGKNLLGTITQPAAIFMEINYLKALPKAQIVNGMAEVIKYGVILDKKLFKYIERNLVSILECKTESLIKIIKRSVEIKASVIEKDEKEAGKRMLLNYGHTYGHAIEKLSNYKVPHGFAISIGMAMINEIAQEKGFIKKSNTERIQNLLKATGLPVTSKIKPTIKDLLTDKKKIGNEMNFIYPVKIGKAIIHKEDVSKPQK